MKLQIHLDTTADVFYFSQSNNGSGVDILDEQWNKWQDIDSAYYDMQEQLKEHYSRLTE